MFSGLLPPLERTMTVETIAFHITDRCQLNCDHCLRDPGLKSLDIDVELVRNTLVDARRLYGATETSFTGGEPTLHPRFLELVDAAVDTGYRWRMVSNGERFPRVLASLQAEPKRLKALSAFNFSLDGASETTHDMIRGKGSYRTVLGAVSLAVAHEFPVVLQLTVTRANLDEIEEFALLAAQLGAKRVTFGSMQPSGTFHDWSLGLKFYEFARVVERIQRLSEILTIEVSGDEGFNLVQPMFMCESFLNNTLHIDPSGNLNLCCRYSGIPAGGDDAAALANLNEVSLADAHSAMIRVSANTITARLQALDRGLEDAWDQSPCNFCFKCHGKPHWTAAGPTGPSADRPRWRGAWEPEADKQEAAAARKLELEREGSER